MAQSHDKKGKLDKILRGLDTAISEESVITRPISVRIPLLQIARIDTLAKMKHVSRNTFLNDVIEAALDELIEKLEEKNPKLAKTVQNKVQQISKRMMNEPMHPGPPPPPHERE